MKAYYRRGSANYALRKLKLALKDFRSVLKRFPSDSDAKKRISMCEKEIMAENFANAVACEGGNSGGGVGGVSEVIDPEPLIVDKSYDGPQLPVDEG